MRGFVMLAAVWCGCIATSAVISVAVKGVKNMYLNLTEPQVVEERERSSVSVDMVSELESDSTDSITYTINVIIQ